MPAGVQHQGRHEAIVSLQHTQVQEIPTATANAHSNYSTASRETATTQKLLRFSSGHYTPHAAPIALGIKGHYLLLDESRPFTMLCLGEPGSGKSNTLNLILENHILRRENKKPFGAIVFCFADTKLIDTMPDEAVVLVSPANQSSYQTYESKGIATQKIKLNWAQLSVRALGGILQCWATAGVNFLAFGGESFVDFGKLLEKYRRIVVDLADPLLSPYEANVVMSDLLSLFRSAPLPQRLAGKMVIFDGAHKLFLDASSPLSTAVVSLCEDVRQQNTRMLITSETTTVIPPDLFLLSTFAVIHHLDEPNDWEGAA